VGVHCRFGGCICYRVHCALDGFALGGLVCFGIFVYLLCVSFDFYVFRVCVGCRLLR